MTSEEIIENLHMWSGSTLAPAHARLGFEAAERIKILESRIEQAKALAGHKSLDSRRELLAILEGEWTPQQSHR